MVLRTKNHPAKYGQNGWSWQKGYSKSDNYSLQVLWAEKLLRKCMCKLEVDATAAEDHVRFHSCQPRIEIWGCNGHRFTSTGQLKTGKKHTLVWWIWISAEAIDCMVRNLRQQLKYTDQTGLVSTVQAGGGGVTVWGMLSWHIMCP